MGSQPEYDSEAQPHEVDKYEKVAVQRDLQKQRDFQAKDIGSLKIVNMAVLFLSFINLVFSIATSRYYKLSSI